MFRDWSSYAFIRLEGREAMEMEILAVQPAAKTSATDLFLPGAHKEENDTHSVDTLIRAIHSMTGLRVKPDRVRRIRLPDKGRTGKHSHRLRFYLVTLSPEQFLDRDAISEGAELRFIPLSTAISMRERIEPHGDLIRRSGLLPDA